MKATAQALAQFSRLNAYEPQIGDFVIWAGLFSTWYGVVASVSEQARSMAIIFEKLPVLLFSLNESEHPKNNHVVKLHDMINAKSGVWSVSQHNNKTGDVVWYV